MDPRYQPMGAGGESEPPKAETSFHFPVEEVRQFFIIM